MIDDFDAASGPSTATPSAAGTRPAAFFGLDRTLIAGSTMYLIAGGPADRRLSRIRGTMGPAGQQVLARLRSRNGVEGATEAALRFVRGRERGAMEALACDIAEELILPQVHPHMATLVERHRQAGALTFVTTAAPAEVAEVVARGLGMDGGLGTRAEVDGSECYSGRLEGPVLWGAAKATAVQAHAAANGIDLSTSAAYSDSISDIPLLELVGRPHVVNPDRRLRRVACERNWPMHQFAGPGARGHHRPPGVTERLASLGLTTTLQRDDGTPSRRGHIHFTVDDADRMLRELEQSGRFRRDSRLGSVFHPGRISLREVSAAHSLHITLAGNRVSAHLDRYSPLAETQPETGCRYSLPRVAAHNLAGMAGDVARLLQARRSPTCSEGTGCEGAD